MQHAHLDRYDRRLLSIPNDLFDCAGAMGAVDVVWLMMAPAEVPENDAVWKEVNDQWRAQVQQ